MKRITMLFVLFKDIGAALGALVGILLFVAWFFGLFALVPFYPLGGKLPLWTVICIAVLYWLPLLWWAWDELAKQRRAGTDAAAWSWVVPIALICCAGWMVYVWYTGGAL